VKLLARIAATSAALAALVAPALALGQSAAPTITQSSGAGFPDRAYLLQLPSSRALTAAQVEVTENGSPVAGLAVVPPGGSRSGAILLIDASNSMEGAPIKGAMAAARAFLAERKDDLPVAVVVFGPDDSVLTDFTTDAKELAASACATISPRPPSTIDASFSRAESKLDWACAMVSGRGPSLSCACFAFAMSSAA